MSKINQIIPKQGFEIVRDLIGSILKIELENQKTLQKLPDEINIYSNRLTPFQASEKLMINCSIDSNDFSNKHQSGVHSKINFFIDIYCSSKENQSLDGAEVSAIKRDKYLGMIRYILDDTHYMALGLPLGKIMGTSVEGFENFESGKEQETSFVKMSRLTFGVRMIEQQSLWLGIDINSIFTDVKLDLTDKGYKYEIQTT
jgi:hypothetical protein